MSLAVSFEWNGIKTCFASNSVDEKLLKPHHSSLKLLNELAAGRLAGHFNLLQLCPRRL